MHKIHVKYLQSNVLHCWILYNKLLQPLKFICMTVSILNNKSYICMYISKYHIFVMHFSANQLKHLYNKNIKN